MYKLSQYYVFGAKNNIGHKDAKAQKLRDLVT